MKKLISLIVMVLSGTVFSTTPAKENFYVKQEIRYHSEDAREVYLVWGINNWKLLPVYRAPAGSFVKDNLMYSPMFLVGEDMFSATVEVPSNSMVDYVFWVTKGPMKSATDVWDVNRKPFKDYHTLASQDNIVQINSNLFIRPGTELSILDFSFFLLGSSVLLFGITFFFKRKPEPEGHPQRNYILKIAGLSIAALLMLFFIRASVLRITWEIIARPGEYLPRLFYAGYYDFMYLVTVSIVFSLTIFILKKYPVIQRALLYIFTGSCLLSIVAALLNIKMVEMLGKPFNYQWLYYSDFLRSNDSRVAVMANISGGYVLRICCVTIATIFLAFVVFFFLKRIPGIMRYKKVSVFAVLILTTSYCYKSKSAIASEGWSYDRLSNPVSVFLQSVNPFASAPDLFTMAVPDSLRELSAHNGKGGEDASPVVPRKIKNVMIFVLESVPAEYIGAFGSKYGATPRLDKYAESALLFENIYAHAPATNLSMLSLLCSVYPPLSYNSITEENPGINIPSLSSELKRHGYRTAFFNSGDNRFQKAGEFLENREFEKVTDFASNACGRGKFEVNNTHWNFMDGLDDACTGENMGQWIKSGDRRPFFSVMWTFQTHYPYFFDGKERNFPVKDTSLNRYLNALAHADEVFGKTMDDLQKTGLLDSTLVLVIGDHGEAFGRHGQRSHGRMIYEENLHVPCIVIRPAFIKKRNKTVGGMVDIAPTVMDILGYKPAPEWQGLSLLKERKNNRVYFFAPWSDYLFGYREGGMKFIYNATNNTTEIYDLKKDPFETRNLADFLPDKKELAHLRLAAWAQQVNSNIERVMKLQPVKEVKVVQKQI